MARKKDPEIKEDVTRGKENKQKTTGIDAENNHHNADVTKPADTIKNANATGLGAMGRNDQKQTGYDSNHLPDAGNE